MHEDSDVVLSGDIHGHGDNLAKIVAAAALPQDQRRTLVLQEVIHGPPDAAGCDPSIRLLVRAAKLKIAHPQQVLFLLGNHDVAQLTGSEITKAGVGVCRAFVQGVGACFGDDAEQIIPAVNELLLSMPLVVRCPNGVWMSHSLPSPSRMDQAGTEVLQRPYRRDDLSRGGGVYEWTWGRGHTAEQLETLAARLDVEYFLLAHRHSPQGVEIISDRGLAVLSDHAHGCVIRFAASAPVNSETIPSCIRPISSLSR